MMYGFGWNGISGWGWVGMTLMMVFWFAILALFIYAISRAFWRPSQPVTGLSDQDRAMNLLRERFARGEITSEEYQKASSTLRSTTN